MQRHITDHSTTNNESSRLRAYWQAEREAQLHPVYRQMHRQARPGDPSQKMARYLRIERGDVA